MADSGAGRRAERRTRSSAHPPARRSGREESRWRSPAAASSRPRDQVIVDTTADHHNSLPAIELLRPQGRIEIERLLMLFRENLVLRLGIAGIDPLAAHDSTVLHPAHSATLDFTAPSPAVLRFNSKMLRSPIASSA